MQTRAEPSRLHRRFDALCESTRTALSDEAGALSFGAVGGEAQRLAQRLKDEFSATGDADSPGRVALLAGPGRDWVVGFWAILQTGAAVVPLSPLHPVTERRGFFEAAGADLLLVSSAHREAAQAVAAGKPTLELPSVASERLASQPSESPAGVDVPSSLAALTPLSVESEERIALIMFTSGTTARPKVVPLSHKNLYEQALSLHGSWGMSAQDVLIHSLPLHHVHGISVAFLLTFLSGGETVFLPRFDPEAVLSLAQRATVLMGVPAQYKRLVDYLDAQGGSAQNSLRCLRLLTSGSAKLPERLGRRIEGLAGQYPVERYGMTEIGIVLSNSLSRRTKGSCGAPLPGCRVRVVNEQGQDVVPGEVGELWVAGPTVFSGYHSPGLPESQDFVGEFFRTGDWVRQNLEGDVFVHGRSSVDIIKSGGYKLSALEAEELLREHPGVTDVAVVGVPDEDWGEAMVAVVIPLVPTNPETLEAELRSWVKQHVAGYKVPKRVLFAPELPRNALGKVQKKQLILQLPSLDR